MKKLEDMTFEEVVDYAAQQIHFALLERGSKGFKSCLFLWMDQAIRWQEFQDRRKKKHG